VRAAKEHFGARWQTVDIDGVRITFDHGWALLRASNTQPVIVARAEGESEADLEEIEGELDDFLRTQSIAEVAWEG
jgi:phosphomannomutase/phosphoglucomutase